MNTTVKDWLQQLWNVAYNGVATAGEIFLNFLPPITVTDNPTGGPEGWGSIDIGLNVSGLLGWGGVQSGATYVIPASSVIGFDTTANAVALSTPTTSADGTEFAAFDAGRAVEGTYGASLVDSAHGYLIENPIDLSLNASLNWGPGSGGGGNPNLPNGKYVRLIRVTCANANGGNPYWQAVSA